jgi:hypothetical protein
MAFKDIIKSVTGRSFLTDTEKRDLQTYAAGVAGELRNQAQARKQAIDKIIEDQVDRIKQDIKSWREAIDMAEDVHDPDPFELYQLYVDILDDDQVHSTKQQRIAKATGGKIQLKDENNEIDDEATAVLIKPDGTPQPWFREFLQICMMSKFYGYSITQFRPPVDNKFQINLKNGDKPVEHIPFENMIPRLRAIRKDINSSVQDKANRIPIWGGPGSDWLIPCGRDKDLGLLNKVAPFWIYKKVFGSWTQHANIFGMPLRVGKTDIFDKKRYENMHKMLASMDKATWVALHPDDDVEFVSNNQGSGNGSDIYKNLVEKCDQAIAKIILSQTGTTDEKSFAGSAEVHAGVMDDVTWSDKLDLAAVIDEQLIPFLKRIGMLPEGAQLFASWELDDEVSLTEWATIIKELAVIFDMDPEEIGKKFNLSLEAKEAVGTPGTEETEEQKKNREELQNVYKKYFK